MSSVIDSSVDNFNGGRPESRDLVPSILFSVLLGLTLPILIWRILSKKHGSKININALMFFLLRLASQIMRAYMSRRSYGNGVLVAQLALVSIGYLFLANAAIDLWQRHSISHANHKHARRAETVSSNGELATSNSNTNASWDQRTMVSERNGMNSDRPEQKHLIVKVVATFLRLLLLASLITAIAAAAVLRKGLDNNEIPRYIDALLKASYILSLATTALGVIGTIVTHFTNERSAQHTVMLLTFSIPLLVVGIYRVVEIFAPRLRASRNALIAFWVCVITFEFLAYLWMLAVSIPKWFGKLSRKVHGDHSHNEKIHGHNGHNHGNDGRVGNATVATGYVN